MRGINPKLLKNLLLLLGKLGVIKSSRKHRLKSRPAKRRENRPNDLGSSEQEKKTYEYLFHGDATMPNVES